MNPNELTDMFSQDTTKRLLALQKFDKLSDHIMEKSTIKNTNLQGGKQAAYYFPSINAPGEGVIFLKYAGKKDTIMASKEQYFNDHFGVKK